MGNDAHSFILAENDGVYSMGFSGKMNLFSPLTKQPKIFFVFVFCFLIRCRPTSGFDGEKAIIHPASLWLRDVKITS